MPLPERHQKMLDGMAYLQAFFFIVMGFIGIVYTLFGDVPEDRKLLLVGLGIGFLGLGIFRFVQLRKVAGSPIYTVDDLPLENRVSYLKRSLLVFAVAWTVAIAMTTYDLLSLEFGWAEFASVWRPVAEVYRFLGFWPAILFTPALGIVITALLIKKLRETRALTKTMKAIE